MFPGKPPLLEAVSRIVRTLRDRLTGESLTYHYNLGPAVPMKGTRGKRGGQFSGQPIKLASQESDFLIKQAYFFRKPRVGDVIQTRDGSRYMVRIPDGDEHCFVTSDQYSDCFRIFTKSEDE